MGGKRETFLVIDAVSGQNGLRQVEAFGKTVPISGLIVTKYDHTAKGGVILRPVISLGSPSVTSVLERRWKIWSSSGQRSSSTLSWRATIGRPERLQPSVVRITGVLHPDPAGLNGQQVSFSGMGTRSEAQRDLPFDHNDYYKSISRSCSGLFVLSGSFRGRRPCGLEAFRLLRRRMSGSDRRVNIDPVTVNGSRLVLASTKDHAHRIYLRDGIFAEVTMRYMRKRWVPFD
jgi:hypothetical protein